MIPHSSSTKPQDMDRIDRLCQQQVGYRVTPQDLEPGGISRETLTRQVRGIVARNLASGRAGWVMIGRRTAALADPELQAYTERVIDCYLQEHLRVEGLAARDAAEWRRLCQQLATRAWSILQDQRMSPARAADDAQDFAQETCEAIFSHGFPYDVPFDAWSGRILRNCILQRRTRSQGLLDRHPGIVSLDWLGPDGEDCAPPLHNLLADGRSSAAFEQVELQESLLQTVARLQSPAQRQVIVYSYFYELEVEQIAAHLGGSKQMVYNLRHRALLNLKKMLGQMPITTFRPQGVCAPRP